jgi:very-short-patch-repair endonuclease
MDEEPAAEDRPTRDPAPPPRVLSRDDALRLGYSRKAVEHRVASGRWQRVLPRTYLTAGTLTWADRLTAAVSYAGSSALISGAAALVEDLDSVRRPATILVLTPYAAGHRSTRWVQVRPTGRMPQRRRAPGPARAEVARAVVDLALVTRRVDDVRALVTEVLRRRLCTVDELAAELDAGPRRGSAHLRRSIEEAAAGAWSAPEARVGSLLRRAGVPRFEQNAPIHLPDGTTVIADFLWRALRAILEIDSQKHHGLPGDRDSTDERHLRLEALGYSVVHRTPWAVHNQPDGFVAGIQAWLAGRAAGVNKARPPPGGRGG